MFRIMRSLLLLVMVLPLLPPASAWADEPFWRGTVVYVYHVTSRTDFTYASWPDYYPTTSYSTETTRIQFDIKPDGTAVQTATYEKKVAQEMVAFPEGEACYGHYWGTAKATSTAFVSAPAVLVTDNYVHPPYDGSGSMTVASKEGDGDACWSGSDGLPPPGSSVSTYIQLWSHNGAFTPEDTSIAGRDRWANYGDGPGGNYVDKVTPINDSDGEGFITETSVRFTSYNLTREELDTPWFSQETKDKLNAVAFAGGVISASVFVGGAALCLTVVGCVLGGPIATAGGAIGAGATALAVLALDPPDPNYTEIAVPLTPTTSRQPVMPGDGVTQQQADALNAAIENEEQAIGLARAILISFNRASGAQAANDDYWVSRQLEAARLYSGQLADILDARLPVLSDLRQSLLTFPGIPFAITAQDVSKYKYDLVAQGFSVEQQQLLTELGLDGLGQEQVLNALLETEFAPGALPEDTVATFPDLLTDEAWIASTQNLAAALREFSQSVPRHTVYLPLLVR